MAINGNGKFLTARTECFCSLPRIVCDAMRWQRNELAERQPCGVAALQSAFMELEATLL